MKTIICCASEQRFAFLLKELIASIRNKPEGRDIAIGVLDTGLEAEDRHIVEAQVQHIVAPGWDVDFSMHDTPEKKATLYHGYKAMASRPSLRKHFPGYDMYIWIDADCWVQEWSTIDWLIEGARGGALCISAELDRAYDQMYDKGAMMIWMQSEYEKFHGPKIARQFRCNPILNTGVFAMRADCALWDIWQQSLQDGLTRTLDLYAEQLGLNKAVYAEDFPRNILPATSNWLVNKALPSFDRETKKFTEPNLPYRPLGIVHLSGKSKTTTHRIKMIRTNNRLESHIRYDKGRLDQKDQDG